MPKEASLGSAVFEAHSTGLATLFLTFFVDFSQKHGAFFVETSFQ